MTLNRKVVEVLNITLLGNCHSLYIRTLYNTEKLDLSETFIVETMKNGGESFWIIKNPHLRHQLYVSDKGRMLNKELFTAILSGNYHKVTLQYS